MRFNGLDIGPLWKTRPRKLNPINNLPDLVKVYVFEGVGLGDGDKGEDQNHLTAESMRESLGSIRDDYEITTLDALNGEPTGHSRAALVFVGGDQGHVRYAAPLLEALGLPAHFFIPLDQLGRSGRLELQDLVTLRQYHGIRLELDLSSAPPLTCRDLAAALGDGRSVLKACSGQIPRFVWTSTGSIPRRFRFLLEQFGIAGVVSSALKDHCRREECLMFRAISPSRRRFSMVGR